MRDYFAQCSYFRPDGGKHLKLPTAKGIEAGDRAIITAAEAANARFVAALNLYFERGGRA